MNYEMKLNRDGNVKGVIKILDKKINQKLLDNNLNTKELLTLIDIRTIYVEEMDGLTRSINTQKMYEKKTGI